MFATDAVFLTEPAEELEIGEDLGMWEIENDGRPYTDFCVFQPGVYFDGQTARFKTRGLPKGEFTARVTEFREAANDFEKSVEVHGFNHLGLKLALSLSGAANGGIVCDSQWIRKLGNWVPVPRIMNASPILKRYLTPGLNRREDGAFSYIYPGSVEYVTVPYQHQTTDIVFNDAEMWADGIYEGDLYPD
jgi:hypothetical protein